MSKETRDKVQKFLDNLPDRWKEPLIFSNEEGSPSKLGIKKAIKKGTSDLDLLRLILTHKDNYYSRSQKTKEVETMPRKHRGSLDIWRHFIFYKPEATLLDVMALLYSLAREVRYQYCNVIKKRVFDLSSSYGGDYHDDATHLDEYKLTFDQWEDINIVGEEEETIPENRRSPASEENNEEDVSFYDYEDDGENN